MAESAFNTVLPTEVNRTPGDQMFLKAVQRVLQGSTLSGNTASRPTNGLWIGQPYFDTTEQTVVTWNGNSWANTAAQALSIANTGAVSVNAAFTQANLATSIAQNAFSQANTATTIGSEAFTTANTAESTAVAASNTVTVLVNDNIVLFAGQMNFNNSASINAAGFANGSFESNISFNVNSSALVNGSNTWIQYNNGLGGFGASANLVYDPSSGNFTVNCGAGQANFNVSQLLITQNGEARLIISSNSTQPAFVQYQSSSAIGGYTGIEHGTAVLAPTSKPGDMVVRCFTGNVLLAAVQAGGNVVVANGNLVIAAGESVMLTGSAVNTSVVSINTSATTGTATATFSASNKPGPTNKTTPDKWIPILLDGAIGYIPWFAA